MGEDNFERLPEKIIKSGVTKEKGYLYYIDEDGDVARVPAKWNKDPKFLDKVHDDELAVNEKLNKLNLNYSKKEEEHDEPIPVVAKNVPSGFKDKIIIYHDKGVVVTINDLAVSKNQVCVYQKENSEYLMVDPEYFVHQLTVSSFVASILYEALGAQGTNIIVNEFEGNIRSSIIPRFENDGLNFIWDMKQGDPSLIKKNASRIKDFLVIGEKKNFNKVNLDRKTNIIDNKQLQKDMDEAKPKVNYMIEHLRRTS